MDRRWKLTLEYEGADFLGWQRQAQGRTVQGELERALGIFCRRDITVMGQGRTDRGVHARGQVAHTDLPESVDAERLIAAMRGLLPKDMTLHAAVPAAASFHARFDARSRHYRYRLLDRPSALHRRVAWYPGIAVDGEYLQRSAEVITGSHDFQAFARLDPDYAGTSRCVINRSEWSRVPEGWNFDIEGDRFLRHMVRRLVGTMVRIATHGLPPSEMELMIEKGADLSRKGHSAPAHGLCLERVHYDDGMGGAQVLESHGGEGYG